MGDCSTVTLFEYSAGEQSNLSPVYNEFNNIKLVLNLIDNFQQDNNRLNTNLWTQYGTNNVNGSLTNIAVSNTGGLSEYASAPTGVNNTWIFANGTVPLSTTGLYYLSGSGQNDYVFGFVNYNYPYQTHGIQYSLQNNALGYIGGAQLPDRVPDGNFNFTLFQNAGTMTGTYSYNKSLTDSATTTSTYFTDMYMTIAASLTSSAPVVAFNVYGSTYLTSMPTFKIGTGSVFQANATTTSTFPGTSTGNYNSTFENLIYSIPIAPNTDYVTVLYNSTWIVSNIYPSTYLPLINNSDFVTMEDVSGFSSVNIELIEPNPFIGQSEPVSLSFNPSGVQFQTGDLNHVSYTPFGSSTTASYTTTQDFLQLPFGASASVYVTNSWGQDIGSTGNFTVTQINSLIINATVSEITMDPLNGTISTLYISGNGYNVSVQPQLSFYLLNNSQYRYYATIPNGNSFPVYPGTIITNSPAQSIPIYGNAPEEGLTIYQNAYNLSQSQLGENNSFSLSPFVKMFIDGKAWQQGQTYDTFAGSVIEIHLETVLNQPLNFQLPLSSVLTLTSKNGYLNFTMPAFSPSYQVYVTTPSYVFGIINAEQVPASSPLATQHNNVSLLSNASINFKYETMVGQESEVYLLAGTAYHFYTHDNITNTLDFTL